MNISVHLGWWIVPALFALAGIILFFWTSVATRKEPKWVSAGPLIFPNPAGLGRTIIAAILILVGAALAAGHFLR